ncbi:MAG: hypothetical protein ACK4XY_09765 [Chloroherpetonaceae bacterium]
MNEQEIPTEMIQHALKCVQESNFGEDKAGEARLLHNIGTLYSESKKMNEAYQMLIKALFKRQEIGDKYGEAHTALMLGFWHLHTKRQNNPEIVKAR